MALKEVQKVIDEFKIKMLTDPSTQTPHFVRPGGWLSNRVPREYVDLRAELEEMIDTLKKDVTKAFRKSK